MSSRGTAAMLTLLLVVAAVPESASARPLSRGIFCPNCRGFADGLDYATVATGLGVVALSVGAVVDLKDPWQPTWFTIAQPILAGINLFLIGAISVTVGPRLAVVIPMAAIDLALVAHTIFRLSNPPDPEVPPPAPIASDAFFRPYATPTPRSLPTARLVQP